MYFHLVTSKFLSYHGYVWENSLAFQLITSKLPPYRGYGCEISFPFRGLPMGMELLWYGKGFIHSPSHKILHVVNLTSSKHGASHHT
jgi:hypothetical protein